MTAVSSTDAPLVWGVMPVYNAAETLRCAIESVRAQTYPHWRLTVHDNCSTDGSAEIVREFDDARIALVRHSEFLPAWANWNRCMVGVAGAFFQLLCADDKLHPECFAEKVRLASDPAYAEVALFSSNRMLIGRGGRVMREIGFGRRAGVFEAGEVMRRAHVALNPIGDPSVGLVRTRAIAEAPFSAEYPFFVDMELWLHVLARGPMLHVPRVLSYFRVTGTALSGTRFWRNFGDSLRFYRRRVKPFYRGRGWRWMGRYYVGYLFLAMRAVVREAVYRWHG